MPFEPKSIKALTFDVGGTVFDWYGGVSRAVTALAEEQHVDIDAGAFAATWRAAFFETLARVRSRELPRMNADAIHRRTLGEIAPGFRPLVLRDAEKDQLTLAWHRLPAWPDAGQAIERLRRRYVVVVLTVLSYALVLDSSKHNGISWDGIISCEFLPHYKPDKEAYLDGLKLLQLEPAQCMMVAAHAWDLEGARTAGMRTGFVPRPLERGPNGNPYLSAPEGVDVISTGFEDLADQLLLS